MYSIDTMTSLNLGEQGEHLANEIRVDMSPWVDEDNTLRFYIVALRHGETNPYIPATTMEDNILVWPVTSADTAITGAGLAQFVATDGTRIVKSKRIKTAVGDVIPGTDSDTPPDPASGWVERVINTVQSLTEDAQAAKADAESAAEHAESVTDGIDQAGAAQVEAVNAAGTAQVKAVQDKGAEVIDSIPEDYSAMTNEVTDLKSAFDTVDNTIFDITEINSVPCSQIPGATMRNGSSNKFSSYISIDSLNTYDSYYKVVDEDTQIWFEETSSAYVSLCVGDSYTGQETTSGGALRLLCSNSERYRKSDSNLPTKQSPVTVPAGGVFVVTVTSGGNDLVYGVAHSVTRQVSSNFAEEVKEKMPVDGVRVELTDTTVILHGDKYNVTFTKKTTTQGYQWNITSLSGKGGNVLPNSTDIIGVIQFDGENNFMGGVHGNENNIAFSIWADGEQITEDGTYENIKIWMASNLYSVNDPSANVVDRYVMFNFDKNGWKCRNTFKLLTSATVKVSYASGLFGFSLSDVDFASCNLGPIPLESSQRMYYKHEFKQVFINFTDNLSVTFCSNTSDLGFITFRTSTNSWKAYFADVNNQVFSAGDYITGESEYIF